MGTSLEDKMSLRAEKTVREAAVESPEATRVFEKLGIDYCCGGNKSLEQACTALNLSVDEVLDSLDAAAQAARAKQQGVNWQNEPLADVIEHIIASHHKYTREEVARLKPLLQKVCSVHGKKHPELEKMQNTFHELAQELSTHMMKEEMVLFPYIVRMEEAFIQKEPVLPAPFGSVGNPVAMMIHEHDLAGIALRTIRQSSTGFTPPADACISYQTLYKALADLETDLHGHIHLENNILFPRALDLERDARRI
jgi:regulator of cell morphogenesis and NO signaling